MRLQCGDVTGGDTCGYHAVMLQEAVRAITTRQCYMRQYVRLPRGNVT